jgi:hypothetical protein
MAKGRVNSGGGSGNTGNTTVGNGGILGSGIFGMFGSTVQCKADDNSMYCSLTKFVNVIIMMLFIFTVIYLLYIAFNYFTSGGKMRGGRKWRLG